MHERVRFIVIGLNFKTAPISVRERVAFAPENVVPALKEISQQTHTMDVALLSTCNRMESFGFFGSESELRAWWEQSFPFLKTMPQALYCYEGEVAVAHMMSVASGLDSMVLGEPQILGQMKQAFALAKEANTAGKLLSRLFQRTFSSAKLIRTQTNVGANPLSVAYIATRLAKHIFENLSQASVLLIGAGDTIERVALHLKDQQVRQLVVANRTLSRAQGLADKIDGKATTLKEGIAQLWDYDIVIVSTQSTVPLLGKGSVERALKARKRRPMFLLDLAVPRNIEPEVNECEDVYLYTVDDLQSIAKENHQARSSAAQEAMMIVHEQAKHFIAWLALQDRVDWICYYRDVASKMTETVLAGHLKQLEQGVSPETLMRRLAYQLSRRLMHLPTVTLRQANKLEHKDILKPLVQPQSKK